MLERIGEEFEKKPAPITNIIQTDRQIVRHTTRDK